MTKIMGAAVALWVGIAATSAQAAVETKACMTEAEAQSVFLAVAPDAIKAVAQKCAPSLPAASKLKGGLAAFVAPFDAAATAAWPQAIPAIAKAAGPEASGMDPAALKPMIGAMAADKLQPKDCATIDRAVTLLAPLPPANVAGLIVLAASSAKDSSGKAPFAICPVVVAPMATPVPK